MGAGGRDGRPRERALVVDWALSPAPPLSHMALALPQVGNAIGRGNRHLFLSFLWLELGAILCSALVAVVRIHEAAAAGDLPSKQVCVTEREPASCAGPGVHRGAIMNQPGGGDVRDVSSASPPLLPPTPAFLSTPPPSARAPAWCCCGR